MKRFTFSENGERFFAETKSPVVPRIFNELMQQSKFSNSALANQMDLSPLLSFAFLSFPPCPVCEDVQSSNANLCCGTIKDTAP